MKSATNSDTGAPAALSRLEKDERASYERYEAETVKLLAAIKKKAPVDEKQKQARDNEIEKLTKNVELLREAWHDTAKVLNQFQKTVPEEKREGEKIGITEARNIIRQIILSGRLAVDVYILSLSQSAVLCATEQDFHKAHAENIRSAFQGAIEAAKREKAIPDWCDITL